MYDIEATVTETSPTVLRLTADWPVDWLRGSGIRTMEIQRQLLHGEILELPSVPKRRSLPAEQNFGPRSFTETTKTGMIPARRITSC
jgi:hypothetical protein